MKIFKHICIIFFLSVYSFNVSNAGFFDNFLFTPTLAEVQKTLILTKSKLKEEVKGGNDYIKKLELIFTGIKSNKEKVSEIQARVSGIKEKSDKGDFSKDASILVDYIYYYILYLQYQEEKPDITNTSTNSIPDILTATGSYKYYEEDCYEYQKDEYCDIETDKYYYDAYENTYYFDDYEYYVDTGEYYYYEDDYYEDDYYREDTPIVRKLEDFPVPSKPWREEFNLKIPEKGFSVVYFNTETGERNKSFTTERISLTEAWEVGNIDPVNDLGAYIIGDIELEETGEYEFTVSQSWSETRIIIDNKLVFGEGDSSAFHLYLEKGQHTIEVEYINNWHTVELLVNFYKPIPKYFLTELKDEISHQEGEVWYVGIYEPDSDNHEVVINIPRNSKSISLVLSSYSPTNWIIKNPYKSKVRDVVFNSLEPGSTVSGVEDTTKIYKLNEYEYDELPNLDNALPDCYDDGIGEYYCEGSVTQFDDLNEVIESIYGKKLTGYVGDYYGAEGFELPGRLLDEAGYKKLEEEYQKLLEEKKKVEEKKTFNNMFD